MTPFGAVAKRTVPPDPGILKALGLNHAFESAIADLVDNSLDAHARRVLIRFVLREGLATQLLIVDNGQGMDAGEIDAAMQLGKPKATAPGVLGHFGVGLKSASFSQAAQLTVLSRKNGAPAVGRRMLREPSGSGFEFEELDAAQVSAAMDSTWLDFLTPTGTVVRWDSIRTFPAASDPAVTSAFIETKVAVLKSHLGLVFHRLLEQRVLAIDVDVLDADSMETGLAFSIEPIDPFAYPRSGVKLYPRTLLAECGSGAIPFICHIWPAGSDSHLFKLAGAPVDRFQGFYFYRNNRLLSAGAWGGVTHEDKRRRLARVAVDIENHLDLFLISVEKSGVQMVADVVRAIENAAAADGTTFPRYLADAEEHFRQANRRNPKRSPVVPPGQGISPRVKRAIAREFDLLDGEPPIRIRWAALSDGDFLDVDRRERTLWLNSRYRKAILNGASSGANDAPLLKALLFLLYEDIFHGAAYGPKDKDNVRIWLEVLTAAAEEELLDYGG